MRFNIPELLSFNMLSQIFLFSQVQSSFPFTFQNSTAAPSHFPLKNVARNIRWFPEFFQQKHKFHSCCSSRKNESRNSYSQCCFRKRGRERFLKCAMSVARASYPPQPGCSWISYLFYISLGYSPASLLLEQLERFMRTVSQMLT